MTPDQNLTAAHQRVREATAEVARRRAALETVQHEHARYERERDDAQAAHLATRPGLAAASAETLRDAEETLGASQRQVSAAQHEVEAAQQDLADAQKAVKSAASEVALNENRELFEQFEAQAAALNATRSQLIGAYLSLHPTMSLYGLRAAGSLSGAQWHKVNSAGLFSFEQLDVGLPIVELRSANPREERQRINEHQRRFAARLAELERGDPIPDSAASEAA